MRSTTDQSHGEHTIHRKRKALAALGCVALIGSASVACDSDDNTSPDAKVKGAFERLGKQKSLSAEVGFDASADKIFTAMKDQDDFDRGDADLLASLRLSYGVSYGKPLKDVGKDDEGGQGSFKLTKKGAPLVEVRTLGARKLYARGDVKALAELADQGEKAEKRAKGGKSSDGPSFDELAKKADELPSSMDSVKSAFKGEWVLLDPKSFEEFGPAAKQKKKDGELDTKTQKQVLDALEKALLNNATYKDAGRKNGADHVTVTVSRQKAARTSPRA
ncbi:hypothetical protein ACFQ2B_14070 [Streptomyces stramineus]